jgi:hypothetical protein
MIEIILVLAVFIIVVLFLAKHIDKVIKWIFIIGAYGILFLLSALAGMIIVFLYMAAKS